MPECLPDEFEQAGAQDVPNEATVKHTVVLRGCRKIY